jgi:prepilin-type processing-associated H-X9-DG protein
MRRRSPTPTPQYAYLHNAYGDNLNALYGDRTAGPCFAHRLIHLDAVHRTGGNYVFVDSHAKWLKASAFTTDAILANYGMPFSDPTDPLITNGARTAAIGVSCPLFCCPGSMGTPSGDGTHPWFRP